jgi:ribonuclease HI
VAFDGSVRSGSSGAAAVLWGPVGEHGDRPVLATATARSDGPGTVPEAEAQACRLGLALLQATDGRYGRAATIAGDNRLIIDHGRFRSRVRAPGIQSFVDAQTSAAEARGWTLRWALLPRQANQEADRLARAARLPGAAASHEWLPVA